MDKKEKLDFAKAIDINVDIPVKKQKPREREDQKSFVSSERLQEAVIWAEILGKPICKRRARRIV